MPKGKVKALLSDPRNFSGVIKGVGGIWQRTNYSDVHVVGGTKSRVKQKGVKLLVAWEQTAQYEANRFPFYKIAAGKARAVIGRNLSKAIAAALRSAK
jgi:hypothetical protein